MLSGKELAYTLDDRRTLYLDLAWETAADRILPSAIAGLELQAVRKENMVWFNLWYVIKHCTLTLNRP